MGTTRRSPKESKKRKLTDQDHRARNKIVMETMSNDTTKFVSDFVSDMYNEEAGVVSKSDNIHKSPQSSYIHKVATRASYAYSECDLQSLPESVHTSLSH